MGFRRKRGYLTGPSSYASELAACVCSWEARAPVDRPSPRRICLLLQVSNVEGCGDAVHQTHSAPDTASGCETPKRTGGSGVLGAWKRRGAQPTTAAICGESPLGGGEADRREAFGPEPGTERGSDTRCSRRTREFLRDPEADGASRRRGFSRRATKSNLLSVNVNFGSIGGGRDGLRERAVPPGGFAHP